MLYLENNLPVSQTCMLIGIESDVIILRYKKMDEWMSWLRGWLDVLNEWVHEHLSNVFL